MRVRLHGDLSRFLPRRLQAVEVGANAGPTDTLKHVIESVGVPHTEIGRVVVHGVERSLADRAEPDLTLEVFPSSEPVSLPDTGFAADGHLGRLAAYLRMLGFDVWCEQSADDAEIAATAKTEARCVLTRDAGLLKRKEVEQGYFLRSQQPREQLSEVVRRFGLEGRIQPFTRCMECNGVLATVAKDEVERDVPARVRALHTEFSRCTECRKVYWRGSHWARMAGWIQGLRDEAADAQ